jgi:hypothetical protein
MAMKGSGGTSMHHTFSLLTCDCGNDSNGPSLVPQRRRNLCASKADGCSHRQRRGAMQHGDGPAAIQVYAAAAAAAAGAAAAAA